MGWAGGAAAEFSAGRARFGDDRAVDVSGWAWGRRDGRSAAGVAVCGTAVAEGSGVCCDRCVDTGAGDWSDHCDLLNCGRGVAAAAALCGAGQASGVGRPAGGRGLRRRFDAVCDCAGHGILYARHAWVQQPGWIPAGQLRTVRPGRAGAGERFAADGGHVSHAGGCAADGPGVYRAGGHGRGAGGADQL